MTDRERPLTYGYLHISSSSPAEEREPADASKSTGQDTGPWVAGYLIVCPLGRPLEFHCTAPVIASPAQVILYGGSLRPFVFGEHLGGTLVGKARITPNVLLVDSPDAEAAGRAASLPTVLLPTGADAVTPVAAAAIEGLPVEAQLLARGAMRGTTEVATLLQRLAESVDLAEPFDRIREAVAEAQRGAPSEPSASQTGAPHRDAA